MRKFVKVVGNVTLVCESKHEMGLKRLECDDQSRHELRMGFGSIRVLACTTLVNT